MAGQYTLPGKQSLTGPPGAPGVPPSARAAHAMLDTPVGVLVQKMAPQFASMLPDDYAKQPLRRVMKEANFVVKSMITSKIGPYLPPGVTLADLEKAVNQPPPPPEKPVEVTKPATPATAPLTKVAGAPPSIVTPPGAAASKGSTTLPQPATALPKVAAAPPNIVAPAAGAPAAAPAAAPPPPAVTPAAPSTPLPQSRPGAPGAPAAPAEGATGPWLDYLNSHGAHATTVKDGKLVNVPLGTPGQYNNLDPTFGSRLYRAAQAYKAETGMEPRFGEGTRGNDVQAIHYKNLQGGKLGAVAHPQDATHKGSNHLHGEAFDIPQGPFLNWLHAHALNYGLAFPVKGDSVHVEMAQGTERQAPYTGGVSAPTATDAPATTAAPAAGAPNAANLTRAGVFPPGTSPEVIAAITGLSNKYGISPLALTGIIKTESDWNPRAGTGSYHGLTQMGPATFAESPGGKLGGMTYDEYLKASPDKQIEAYGAWLDHYKFADKALEKHIDFSTMSPARQAAYLQAFQFSPGNSDWIGGDDKTPVTLHKQAEGLGTTSLADMTAYYEKMFGDGAATPDATPAATPAADPAATPATPTADAGKGLGGSMGGFGEALSAMAGGMYGGGKGGGSQSAQGPTTIPMVQLPRPSGPQPIVDPRMADMQRQHLAQAIQRLNSGKLF